MLYSAWITKMRNEVGDTRRRVHVGWVGDAATTVFQMPTDTFPVLDQVGTYVVKLAGVQKTEVTDYTLDKATGTLVMGVAPGNDVALTIDSSAVYLTDADWLEVTNDTIRSLGDDFWKEVIDDAKVTTANMTELALDSGVIAVYDFRYRASTSDNFQLVNEITNWRYSRDENKIYLGDRTAFTTANQPFRIRVLKTYTLGTQVTDTLDVQDRYLTVIEFGCLARYWRYRYKSVVNLVTKMTTESTRTQLQELIMLVDRCERSYEAEKAKLKPSKPPMFIPGFKEGSPRP